MFRTTALTLAAGLALPLHAQTLSWINPAGGSAATAANWSPVGIPTAANPLVWNLSATYPVSFTAATAASLSQTFKLGRVTLTLPTHTTGPLIVGDAAGDNAAATLAGGTWNVTGIATVGRLSTSVGTLTVNDGDADVVHTGAGFIVGDRGTGTLNLTGGGSLRVLQRFQAGSNAGSTGTVLVDGGRITPPIARSTLQVQEEVVIGGGGDATMRIDRGALATFGLDLDVAVGSQSTSSITVEDQGLVPSRLTVGGNLTLGANSVAGGAAGDGSLFVNTTGEVVVGGVIHLADDPDGGTGLLRMTGVDSTVTCGGLALGAGGSVDLQAGTLTVDHGPFTTPIAGIVQLSGSAGLATLTLRNQATGDLTHVQVGVVGGSTLRVESGSTFHSHGVVALGINTGTTGQATVTGPSSSLTAQSLRVGSAGSGTMLVEAGASIAPVSRIEVAANPGSIGVLTIDGASGSTSGSVYAACRDNGSGGFSPGGFGAVNLRSHAVLSAAGLQCGSQGQVSVDRSTLTLTGHALIAGDLTVTSGLFEAPSMEVFGDFQASGTVRARVGSSNPVQATGPLTLGNTTVGAMRLVRLTVGPHPVTLVDGGPAELGTTSLAGGTLTSASGFTLPSASQLSGTGRVVGDIRLDGVVIPSETAGLAFAGNVTQPNGGVIQGTRILFEPTARYTGHTQSGGSRWHSQPGSRLVFDGPSSIGLLVPDGFQCGGELEVSSTLTIGASAPFSLGTTCTLRNGAIQAFVPTQVGRTGNTRHVLRGVGLVNARVNSAGTVSPGLQEGDPTGTLAVGAYSQTDGFTDGVLEIDIEGPAPDQADLLAVEVAANLAGTLTLRVPPSFLPANGFRRAIITASAVHGSFDRTDAPRGWHTELLGTHVDAVYCAADFNGDGFVDFFDYDDFVLCFETGECPPGIDADFNRDGFADFFDYDDFVQAFESGC